MRVADARHQQREIQRLAARKRHIQNAFVVDRFTDFVGRSFQLDGACGYFYTLRGLANSQLNRNVGGAARVDNYVVISRRLETGESRGQSISSCLEVREKEPSVYARNRSFFDPRCCVRRFQRDVRNDSVRGIANDSAQTGCSYLARCKGRQRAQRKGQR